MTTDELHKMVWNARWIWGPGPGEAVLGPRPGGPPFSVLYFRRTFDLASDGKGELVVHISADSRYRFYVNGAFVGRGPARSDLDHYVFETYDVSDKLQPGPNVLAVQVMHYGIDGPIAEMHDVHGGLCVQGTATTPTGEIVLDTSTEWRCLVDEAYTPLYWEPHLVGGGAFFINPFEGINGAKFPWGWSEADYDDTHWGPVLLLPRAVGRNQPGHPRHRWRLVPREIAHLAEDPVAPETVLEGPRSEDLRWLVVPDGGEPEPMRFAPQSEIDLTIYMGKLFTGYVTVTTSGGEGAEVRLIYAEALSEQGRKQRRDDFTFGSVEEHNPADIFHPAGLDEETYEPIWYRCARYVRLRVRTGDAALELRRLDFRFTSYPFVERAAFESNDPQLKTIWDIAWHTALCCAHEHYEDCPFWEQLQYVSDTRLQILISYYVADDDSLARQAIRAFDRSRLPEGQIQSRYPSHIEQIIPTFSLLYVMMVEDHWRHYGDVEFLRSVAPGIGPIMHWFERHMNRDGLLDFIPWWVFVDWCYPRWSDGVPPEAREGPATAVNLMSIAALESGARLYRVVGDHHHADVWEKRAGTMREAVRQTAWSEREGLFVDGPGSNNLSQHSNLWAILTDTATTEQTARIMERLLDDPALVRTSYIHDYYLFQALVKAGAIDRLEYVIRRWRDMVDYGFSTFPEHADPVRSECHAWSAWPMFEFLRTLLGVKPREPGYVAATIAPKPFGGVTEARGTVPTRRGAITVAWRLRDGAFALRARTPDGLPARIELPDGTVHTAAKGGEVVLGDEALGKLVSLPAPEC